MMTNNENTREIDSEIMQLSEEIINKYRKMQKLIQQCYNDKYIYFNGTNDYCTLKGRSIIKVVDEKRNIKKGSMDILRKTLKSDEIYPYVVERNKGAMFYGKKSHPCDCIRISYKGIEITGALYDS